MPRVRAGLFMRVVARVIARGLNGGAPNGFDTHPAFFRGCTDRTIELLSPLSTYYLHGLNDGTPNGFDTQPAFFSGCTDTTREPLSPLSTYYLHGVPEPLSPMLYNDNMAFDDSLLIQTSP